jgi:cellulose synthase/poly-beta-1,6-N-acetylglucosamine synthase-like glycosyltransferase
MSEFDLGVSFLLSQSGASLIAIFWYTILFEIPRYSIPFLAAALGQLSFANIAADSTLKLRKPSIMPKVSVVVVGHNEADSLETCVHSLCEQSFDQFEIIIVSDGSSDATGAIAARLVGEGLATRSFTLDLRGGKSSALNLAIGACRGDIIITVDCDCSYDRFAIERLLEAFDDPVVGGACGDVRPRNGDTSLVARFQEIEYLMTISVGKIIVNAFDQVTCLSGAFSGFRREALEMVGAFDVGGGEDLDITLKLRARGWRIAFVPTSVCYTDVPVTLGALVRQRLRWERDAIRLRYRKHRAVMFPNNRFILAEAIHQWEFLLFNVLGAFAFLLYLIWLFVTYGDMAVSVLIAMQLGLLLLDSTMLALGAFITGRPAFWRNLVYVLGFSLFMSYVMRLVRLWAYLEEWLLFGSVRDNYLPYKVRAVRKW